MAIEKAMEIEKEYLALKFSDSVIPRDIIRFQFKHKILLQGFKTLNEFSKAKQSFIFKNTKFKIANTSPETVILDIQKAVKSKSNVWYNYYNGQKLVYVGKNKTYNKKYCKDNKITVIPFLYNGGMIVTTEFDYGLVIVANKRNLINKLQEQLQTALKNLGIETVIDGNDLLIKDYKVIGGAKKNLTETYTCYYFQISFKVNLDDINNICNKKMIKVPKGINNFYPNVTREMLWGELQKWLI